MKKLIIIGLLLVFSFVWSGCGNNEIGRYQIVNIGENFILMVDTKTGVTKVVAYAGSGKAAHQFGVTFEKMEAFKKPGLEYLGETEPEKGERK